MANCTIAVRHRNLRLHWVSSRGWFASRGYTVLSSSDEGQSWDTRCTLRTGWAGLCSRHPLLADAGRLGIHNLICLASNALICVADGVVFRSAIREVLFCRFSQSFKDAVRSVWVSARMTLAGFIWESTGPTGNAKPSASGEAMTMA